MAQNGKMKKKIELTPKDAGILLSMASNMDDDLEDYFSYLGDEKVKEMRRRWEKLKDRLIKIREDL